MKYPHRPVLVRKAVEDLVTRSDGIYVDGTAGSGGHSEAIGKKIGSKGRLICLDRDSEVLRLCRERLSSFGGRVVFLVHGNYAELGGVLQRLGIERADGVLLDLGMSSYQLEESGRGFSFNRDEPLDMRMDPGDNLTACQLVNNLAAKDLEKILWDYGEEKKAKSIVKKIEKARSTRPIETSLQLANLIRAAVPPSSRAEARHPATRTFQALRVAVNRELENLKAFLENAPSLITKGGRLVVLSYHSLEDRLVKEAMMNWEKGCICPRDFPVCKCGKVSLFKRLHKKGIRPGQKEIELNPRARSAILRAAERI